MYEKLYGFGFALTVSDHERVLAYDRSTFFNVLTPGRHWFWGSRKSWTFTAVSLNSPWLPDTDRALLATDARVLPHVDCYAIKDTERALVSKDGRLVSIIRPGLYVMFKTPIKFQVEVFDVAQHYAVAETVYQRIAGHDDEAKSVKTFEVPAGHVGLEYVNKALTPTPLAPGRYSYWIGPKSVQVEVVDMREQNYEIAGQELLTKDKVSIRVNLSMRVQVVDAVVAVTKQANYRDAAYRELQLALRSEIGALSLEELLEKKEDLGAQIVAKTSDSCAAFGVRVLAGGVRDVILPGEMRTILNQVIEAEKRAQANALMRREETAATRSLLNTAKLLENNPLLLRLKELESTERIAEKIAHLSIYGGFDGVLRGIQAALPSPAKESESRR